MSIASLLGAGAAGATMAYLLDPRSGRRRRALLRDRAGHATRAATDAIVCAGADLEHRAHGLVARTRSAVGARGGDADDATVVARVRSRLGRVAASVHAICVDSRDGVVELTGHVLEDEARTVLRTVRATRGVRAVSDRLERSTLETGPPALRRTPAAARRRPGFWQPATRLAVGAPAAAALLAGLRRGGIGGAALALLGAAGVLRSATNRGLAELVGAQRPSRGLDVQKTIAIRAPVDEVYRFFTAFENFPRYMRSVEHVERVDENRWRFRIHGPAGARVELDGLVMQAIPNELLAWTSAEGAPLETTGSARFEEIAEDATRVTIRMTYRPPAGLVGHGVAWLLRADPKHELDEDMLRLQSLLEHGKATGHDGPVTLRELRSDG